MTKSPGRMLVMPACFVAVATWLATGWADTFNAGAVGTGLVAGIATLALLAGLDWLDSPETVLRDGEELHDD